MPSFRKPMSFSAVKVIVADTVIRGYPKQVVQRCEELAEEAAKSQNNALYHTFMQTAEHYRKVGVSA